MAELLVHRLFAESAGRAEIGHRHTPFQRAANRHHFTENHLHVGRRQRPRVALGNPAQHHRFALGTKHRRIGFGFDVADFLRQTGAPVQQIDDLGVDRIDLLTQGFEFFVAHRASTIRA